MPRPMEGPPGQLFGWRRLRAAAAAFDRHQQFIAAGHLAFVGLFALFPFLIVLVTVAGLVGSTDAAGKALNSALTHLPPDVAGAIGPVARQVINAPRGGTLTLGLITALWAASSGFEGLRYAFNLAYGVTEQRQLWKRRLQSLLLTLVFALVVVLSTLSVVVVPIVVRVLANLLDLEELRDSGTRLFSRTFGLIILVAATAAIYKVLPRPRLTWAEVLPGALLSVFGWFALASVFGFYLSELATLSLTYGSLGGVVATLMFLYLTATVVLFGCEVNAAGRNAQP